MKKQMKIILLILLIVVISSTIYVYAFDRNDSNTTPKGDYIDNISITSKEVIDNNVEKNMKIKFLDENEISLTYKKSLTNNELKASVYTDSSNNAQYIYSDGELVGYYKNTNNNKQAKQEKISKEESINKAKDIVLKLTNNSISLDKNEAIDNQYKLISNDYVESYNEYNIVFAKMIGEYKTNDTIKISLDSFGNINSFCANRQGLFKNISDLNINEKDVADFIHKEIEKKYGKADYEVEDKIVNILNNKPVLQCYIRINQEDYITSEILVYYL